MRRLGRGAGKASPPRRLARWFGAGAGQSGHERNPNGCDWSASSRFRYKSECRRYGSEKCIHQGPQCRERALRLPRDGGATPEDYGFGARFEADLAAVKADFTKEIGEGAAGSGSPPFFPSLPAFGVASIRRSTASRFSSAR